MSLDEVYTLLAFSIMAIVAGAVYYLLAWILGRNTPQDEPKRSE